MLSKYSFFTREKKVSYTVMVVTWIKKVKQSDNLKKNMKNRFEECKAEIFKTVIILKKLLTAGRTNSHLKDTYEQLGRIIESKIDRGEINIDDPKVKSYLHTIRACKKDLNELEEQVRKIKVSPSPEDISRRLPPKDD